ncbi:hypothetical protein ACTD5D_40435 [Nocardia takedensis]|uniref:hypothetical protein n=1 Tax=Nocardia takedensis TaxID=259390 RepID=UPI003F76E06E
MVDGSASRSARAELWLASNAARSSRRRRSANLESGKRDKGFLVRVSTQEHAAITAAADELQITPPRLMREAALAPELPVSPTEFRELIHQLLRAQGALREASAALAGSTIAQSDSARLLAQINTQASEIAAVLETVSLW